MQQKQFSTKSDGKLVFFEMLKGKTKIHQNPKPGACHFNCAYHFNQNMAICSL